MAEFVLNGNAHSYGSGTSFGPAAGAATKSTNLQPAIALHQQSSVNSTINLDDDQNVDNSLLTADRQMELLLWLSNLELRLPPYGDVN